MRKIFIIILLLSVVPSFALAAFDRFLDFGSTGSDVTELQSFLKEKGFFPNNQEVTDFFGPTTKDSLAKYQASVGINPIGRFGPQTQAFVNNLFSTVNTISSSTDKVLSIGLSGDEIVKLQQFLKEKGFYNYPEITGYFGPVTQEAVIAFQLSQGDVATGTFNTKTFSSTNDSSSNLVSEDKNNSNEDNTTEDDDNEKKEDNKKSTKSGGGGRENQAGPIVSIADPSNNDSISGDNIDIEVDVEHEGSGVVGVRFFIDSVEIGSEDTSAPYSVNWDSRTVVNGSHEITAVIRDSVGNSDTSQAVTVTTENYDFYVDSENGDDDNNGQTINTPFQTLAATTTAIGSDDDLKIGFAKDSVWNEEFILTSNNGIELSTYGSGDMPLIDAGETIPPESFTLTAGRTNTYETPITVTGQTGVEQRLVWEDGSNLRQVADINTVESTPGSFYYASYSAASTTLYIHPKNSTNPTSDGKTYDYTKRYYAVSITGNDAVIDGLRTRRQRANDGSVVIYGINGTMKNGIGEDGHKHVAYLGDGGLIDNYVFKNAYNGTSGFPNYVVFHRNTGSGLGMTVTDTEFTTDTNVVPSTAGGLPSSFPSAIISHISASGDLGDAVTSNNTMTMTTGYGFANFTGLTSTDDTWINSTTMGSTGSPVEINFIRPTYSVPNTTFTAGTVSPYFYSLNPSSGRLAVNYEDMDMNIGVHVGKIAGNKLDTTITDSTITTGAQTGFPMGAIRIIGSDNTLTINNTIIDVSAWLNSRYYNLATDTVYVGDNNTFRHAATGAHVWERNNASQASNIAAWRTYSSQDANSTEGPAS